MTSSTPNEPSWQALYAIAATQEGQFTTQQAATAGYSPPLLDHHQKAGRITRIRRGIYRLVHFPPGEQEEFVTAWLWTDAEGVFSHETALLLQGLSDALPSKIHLTLPVSWQHRRFRVPEGLVLHHANISPMERGWVGAVPVTTIPRTLNDCALTGVAPDLLRQAAQQALSRGLVTKPELTEVETALKPFGGIKG
jgi:predicted transcriptional regulator of viral defense system